MTISEYTIEISSSPFHIWLCKWDKFRCWLNWQAVSGIILYILPLWAIKIFHYNEYLYKHRDIQCDRPDGCTVIQGDLDRLEKEADGDLTKLNEGNSKVLPLGRNNFRDIYTMRANWLERIFAEKDLRFWWTTSWSWAINTPLQQKKANSVLVVLGRTLSADQERWVFPFPQHWWGHTWCLKTILTVISLPCKHSIRETQNEVQRDL